MSVELRQKIFDVIVEFNWSNYGLDEVEDADTEYADALADRIARRVWRVEPLSGPSEEAP